MGLREKPGLSFMKNPRPRINTAPLTSLAQRSRGKHASSAVFQSGHSSGRTGGQQCANPEVAASFDDLVGAGDQSRRHFEAKGLRRFQIDDQLEFAWLEKGEVSRIGPLEDFIDEVGN